MNAISQAFRLPAPSLTEKNLPSQEGRVFIVTGGYAGVGFQLCRILHLKHGTVYVAGRSQEKASKAIEDIKSANPDSKGRLEFLQVDLADLTTIKKAADDFMFKESRLDVLTNNAGIMRPPEGMKSAQGYEVQMGTNVLGPYLLTKCLMPILRKTAESAPPGSVRVTWAGSVGIDVWSPKPGGVTFDNSGNPTCYPSNATNYGVTKVANLMLATEFARRFPVKENRVITNAWNPGNLRSELQRHAPSWLMAATSWMLYPPVYGAYTELFAGWSEEAGVESSHGKYIWPWGRFGGFRQDIEVAIKPESEGGTGIATKLWDWCEKETKQYT